ncbi:MAG: phosphoribosylaminoimidazolesuccinocarboxamide synthase [candidate division Zixibacteria bacterium]|jgi:phosphoribosylaminoimidazole-succinocarboxamide synthase|nr:phosphoribosylaminoimidazolesuccinocarboxamide synthase [candidate division Zixibacteria bacterium]
MTEERWEFEIGEYPKYARGKVREIYDLDDKLLFIASDRMSAFDVVLPTPVPDKGNVLTAMSVFWFDFLKDVAPNHFVTANVDKYPEPLRKYRSMLEGRSMLVTKCQRIDVECIVRGYISGSLWKEYCQELDDSFGGKVIVNAMEFPGTLKESAKLPAPIFTPSTKADSGHDENISFDEMVRTTGVDVGERLKQLSIDLYSKAADYAAKRGIIIADTKFEFGVKDGQIILIDEVLSPDSSRFWPADEYEPGRSQRSFDKQFVRDWLQDSGWDKTPPAPPLPDDIIGKTADKYRRALEILTQK